MFCGNREKYRSTSFLLSESKNRAVLRYRDGVIGAKRLAGDIADNGLAASRA